MRLGLTLGVSLLLPLSSASAQCLRANGQSAPYAAVKLNPSAGLPAAALQALSEGMNAWNAGGCNVGGDDFPQFVTSGTAGATIAVQYNPGLHPMGVCSEIIHTTTNGSGATITLYGRGQVPEGEFDCMANGGTLADTVAHELGHYLGLGESDCDSHIMGPRAYSVTSNGQISFSTSREVQSEECTAADDTNATPQEERRENPPPPEGGATDPGAGAVDCCTSPIIIDLDGHGFALTSIAEGVRFDLDADGWVERTSWTAISSGEVFLVLDRNGNGWVDDGTELFGNLTSQPQSEHPNGYLALAVFDDPIEGGNADGQISAADLIFDSLRLWKDASHDGLSQADEITSLKAQGVMALHLEYRESRRRDRHGNELRYWSVVEVSGRRPFVFSSDVFFRVQD